MMNDMMPRDAQWGRLADAPAGERSAQMRATYMRLASMSEAERREKLTAMANAEYDLPDDKLRTFTMSRMRTWLDMEMDTAKTIASSYSEVMKTMRAPIQMRRIEVVQTLAREFTQQDQEKLHQLVPNVFGLEATAASTSTQHGQAEQQAGTAASKKGKAWWAFWRAG